MALQRVGPRAAACHPQVRAARAPVQAGRGRDARSAQRGTGAAAHVDASRQRALPMEQPDAQGPQLVSTAATPLKTEVWRSAPPPPVAAIAAAAAVPAGGSSIVAAVATPPAGGEPVEPVRQSHICENSFTLLHRFYYTVQELRGPQLRQADANEGPEGSRRAALSRRRRRRRI
eukprot:TRINITY_DN5113_c0_g1_i3.p1 TRINITY_DN5113_c0_g1~~TRINITY_DN5113_c0_g1_i3.p1  ORF type:complete len:174 (+),score=13.75 TRINITY_DN5113_c0_g1_i3:197-718(+)